MSSTACAPPTSTPTATIKLYTTIRIEHDPRANPLRSLPLSFIALKVALVNDLVSILKKLHESNELQHDNTLVDAYITKAELWKPLMDSFVTIVHECIVKETLKADASTRSSFYVHMLFTFTIRSRFIILN